MGTSRDAVSSAEPASGDRTAGLRPVRVKDGFCFGVDRMASWQRYGLALGLFALAFVVRLVALPTEFVLSFITFFPATAAAVLLGGLGPGLLVMLLSGVVGHYVFMPPFWSFKMVPEQASALTVFYVAASLICLIVSQMHRARAMALAALRDMQAAQREAADARRIARAGAEEILSSITDGFYALDREWRFTYVNPRAEEMLGRKREDILRLPLFDVFPMVRGSPVYANYQQVMADRKPLQFEAVSPILKAWVSFSVYPGGDGGISVYFRDISAAKAAEAELVAAKAEAERANLAKSKFLATASHDLRQPVQSLVLFLDTMKASSAGTGLERPVHYMEQAVQSLNTMLNALLDLSRLDAGALLPQVAAVDVGQLVRRIGAECEPRALQKGLRLGRHAPSMVALADPAFVERILRNLLENALRYTETGGIILGCRRRGPLVRIDVIDTGIGIPEEHQRAIFGEYVQVGSDVRDRAKGLGLGLAIVSRLVSLMGGRIEVTSWVGRGSRFSVFLPATDAEAPGMPCEPAAVTGDGKRILIIDDEEMVRESLHMMLESWGFEVVDADSEESALVAEVVPDAIVADYRLKRGRNGIDAAQRLRQRHGHAIPTVIVTGDTAPERIRDVLDSGFLILHKPVGAEELGRTMAQLLRLRG